MRTAEMTIEKAILEDIEIELEEKDTDRFSVLKGVVHGFFIPGLLTILALVLGVTRLLAPMPGLFYLVAVFVLYSTVFADREASRHFQIIGTIGLVFILALGDYL